MAAGAFNTVSSEFDNAVLQDISPAISETMENVTWDGATTAQKALIAGLTPGAPQGSISAGAQTLVAASPTNLVNSIPAIILHNDSISKDTPGAGLGDYKKVRGLEIPEWEDLYLGWKTPKEEDAEVIEFHKFKGKLVKGGKKSGN